MAKCRVCVSDRVRALGDVKYYTELTSTIYECASCGCRFAAHDVKAYEKLHASESSCYGLQIETAAKAKRFFDKKDLKALGDELSLNPKYGEIIRAGAALPKHSRILEVGCSRGYLTAYFILSGYDVRGTEISEVARSAAISDFGPHFYDPSNSDVSNSGSFDFIYHIGTIGCVADPVGMTNSLIDLLKPGGQLIFNAPNVNACWYRGQLWIDYAVPPDVVTLYMPGVWKRIFSKKARVVERIGKLSAEQSLQIAIRRVFRKWEPPVPLPLDQGLFRYKFGPPVTATVSVKLIHRVQSWALALFKRVHLLGIVPKKDAPFDMFIMMRKL